jgi:polar amino acid transport system substrate-binding protein
MPEKAFERRLFLFFKGNAGGIAMKKNYVVLFVLSICAAAVFTMSCSKKAEAKPAAAESAPDGASPFLQQLRKNGVLKVGSSGDSPFAYIDQKTGSFDGVDAEIIKEVAKRLGIAKVDMALIPFSELILNLNSGNIDIIADCMYTRADRGEKVYFGDIWYTQGGGLLASEKSPVNGQSTFDPKTTKVGYTEGTAWQYVVQGWQKDGLIKEAVGTGDQSESIVALQYGKIDAFLTDSTVIESLFANSPDTLKGLKLCTEYKDVPETIGRIAPSVSFDHIAFMKEINNVMITLRDEGFIDEVFKKYGLDPKLHTITNDPAQRVCTINSRDN